MAKENFFKKHKKIILGILFTLLCLAVWRIAVHIELPFLDYTKPEGEEGGLFGFLDMFSGGALSSFSIVALGISPYITASIVVQLLQMDIIPQFKEWAEEGEAGKEKLNKWTRYIALFLAFVQALALVIGYEASYGTFYFAKIENFEITIFHYIFIALVMTAGTAFTLWLADQITMKGIGNGSSLLIVAGIIAGFPTMISAMWKFFITGEYSEYFWREGAVAEGALKPWGWIFFVLMILFFILIICAVIWMEGLVRKIPIQYSNRPAAAKIRGNQDSNMPIKLNSASVIPVIFASTLLSLPTTILQFVTTNSNVSGEWIVWLNRIFNYDEPIGYAIYVILIFVFAFFYSFLQIDPDKVADNLKKNNAYIPGVKPGEATAQFISKTLFRVTLLGATYLTVLASLPIIVSWCFAGVCEAGLPASIQIGGTSLMIVVGVAQETVKQIKTQAQSQEYKGFLK